MGSRQTTSVFSEQSSSNGLGRESEAATNRTRVTTRAHKKRQEPIEPRQNLYGLQSPSQSQSLGNILQFEDSESYSDESTSTRIRTRRNKRTQDIAELDESGSSTSYDTASRPNKRRAIRTEEGATLNEPIILPPPYSDSPRPIIRRTDLDGDSSYLQPFTTGNNAGGVTLPPIYLPHENSTHGGITLPPIRSVLPLGLDNYTDRSRTPENHNEIEVVDLTTSPAADPYPIVDLTSSPSANPSNINSNVNNRSSPDIIVIDDDSSVEDPSSVGSLLPRGLQLKCAICLDYPSDVSTTSCGHIFCRECISTALKSQKLCSLCRHPLTKKQIKRLEFKVLA